MSYLDNNARLASLARTGLTDSPAEPSFDRLTRLASELLGTPVALISLVDGQRQFFKSCVGLPEPWSTQRETPLSHSFCQHVVTTQEPLVINDARLDPLVRDNKAIPDLGVIAYLGVPLAIDGHVIGSFCAIDGKPRAWTNKNVAMLRDLAESIATEIRLRADQQKNEKLLRQLREADIHKDEFLAMLAHELRNPLSVISNAAMLLTITKDPEQLDYSVTTIKRQATHLTRMVDDLLDVSRITLGKIELRRELIDATSILESAASTVGPLVAGREHTLTVTLDRENLWLHADGTRIEQVVVNLLNNAAKYSENGGHIHLSALNDGSDIVIKVRDTGIGIPPEKLAAMFELFAQEDRATSRSEGGLGVGLNLVKRLVEMHSGTVAAHSEGAGKGSEFTVRLPAARQLEMTMPSTTEGNDHATTVARILVVDDNADAVKGTAMLLDLAGHVTFTACDGPQAIAMAQIHQPQVILLDLGLPGMSGYEVVKLLRQDTRSEHALIIAISGYGQEDDRVRTKASGFDNHLTKPIDYDELYALVNSRLGGL